ncbi:MAG TPA: family 10 glycosylhydrolase, partial [Clostridia bacterium]|nr:family 10 glycosylhydrolase [Clostridia bacterium]
IIFQVRPACDAMYASSFEPWSEYLSGVMGKPPEPFYDPLAFAVEEAHRRGLELHAWFNPYRARHIIVRSPVCSSHISKTRPELVRQYGKYLWLDPGEQAVQDYSLKVVMDVVQRYDIDGVHFDDYFYPYKEKDGAGREVDFPDNASWNRFGRNGKLDREDWRRENVNQFIQRAYKSIKTAKPWVKFGISPFGIWRPKNPPQIQGYDAFGKLYADARKWLENGWLDYCAPQLYWGINPPEQSFPVLLSWWGEQNKKHRHLMPGMDSTKTSGRWQPQEIVNQIRITRQKPGVNGHIHWNMKSLLRNPALGEALQREVYAQPALIPALTWVSRATPEKPKLRVANSGNSLAISWGCSKPEKVSRWVLQTRVGKTWITEVLPSGRTSLVLERRSPDFIALTAVDRFGNTSRPAAVQRKESVPIPSPKG